MLRFGGIWGFTFYKNGAIQKQDTKSRSLITVCQTIHVKIRKQSKKKSKRRTNMRRWEILESLTTSTNKTTFEVTDWKGCKFTGYIYFTDRNKSGRITNEGSKVSARRLGITNQNRKWLEINPQESLLIHRANTSIFWRRWRCGCGIN